MQVAVLNFVVAAIFKAEHRVLKKSVRLLLLISDKAPPTAYNDSEVACDQRRAQLVFEQ